MQRDDDSAADNSSDRLTSIAGKDAIVVLDDHQHVLYFNEAAAAIWGHENSHLLGTDAAALGLGDLRSDEVVLLSQGRETVRGAIDIGHRDGISTRGTLSLARIESGCKGCTIATIHDVTAEIERRERMALLTSIADVSSRAVLLLDGDESIVYTNASFSRMFGHAAKEARGHRAVELLAGPHTDPAALQKLSLETSTDCYREAQILLYDNNGDEIWVSAEVRKLRNPRGEIMHIVVSLTDVSETVQLRSLQQLILTALADEVPIGEIADRMCRFVERIAPDVVSSLLHIDALGFIRPLGGPSLPDVYSAALDGVAIGPDVGSCGSAAYTGEPVLAIDLETDPRWAPFKALPLAAGLRACWSSPIKAKDGRVIGTFAFYFKKCRAPSRWHERIVEACLHLGALAIERMEARVQIARLAYYDMLTGLPNRACLRDLIDDAIMACPAGQHVALAFIDIDNFKDVNDTLGHSAGDEFLVAFGQRLRAHIKPGDILGRLGGDEFVIAMPGCDAAGAGAVVGQIAQALTSPLKLAGREVSMSASIGISLYPDNAGSIDMLLRQADTAMYQAKRAGRATSRFYSDDMNGLAEERMIYTAALRDAIAREALELYYQPQIRSGDGSMFGVEALARWNDVTLGVVSPAKFIPLAEECGLIEQIAQWSIRAACRQMAAWRKAGLDIPTVSINLSPINFQNPDLASVVADCLAEFGLPPEVLMIEVTEGVLENEGAVALDTMQALRKLGVGLSLDDFGTGYSSLSRLVQLPIQELKIDRGFMKQLETDSSARAVVTAVIRVAQTLQLSVIAEGVETEGQRARLAELGCDVVQGFLYAPALPPAAFGRWLIDYSAGRAAIMMRRICEEAGQRMPAERSELLRLSS
ncbi:EAL domain-containing protein [Rhodopseudomonas sp. B29]|uniref:EAL domain-containing protein n=1 Tax=Rhodopseudomonas sp. B29 TaxID=95607 RepID=UPI00034A4F33|nr:EAL domain-containing protein [Rhodopseudomonas sp. B29]